MELSLYDGWWLWENCVVIATPYREAVLTILHAGHQGMKSLSRMYVWWPGMTKDIENTVCNRTACQLHQPTPPAFLELAYTTLG